MSIKNMLAQLPEYASDVDKSVREIFLQELGVLEKYQIFGIAPTVGYALRNELLLNYIRPEAKRYLDGNEANACKIASTTMSMTNTYYNFSKKIDDEEIRKMAALFSLDNLNNHNIDGKDFSMYCLAASIINGCEYCINVHIKRLKNHSCSPEAIRDIGRIVSVVKAIGDVLEIERMRSYELSAREETL